MQFKMNEKWSQFQIILKHVHFLTVHFLGLQNYNLWFMHYVHLILHLHVAKGSWSFNIIKHILKFLKTMNFTLRKLWMHYKWCSYCLKIFINKIILWDKKLKSHLQNYPYLTHLFDFKSPKLKSKPKIELNKYLVWLL
jgi:hypothetical protein